MSVLMSLIPYQGKKSGSIVPFEAVMHRCNSQPSRDYPKILMFPLFSLSYDVGWCIQGDLQQYSKHISQVVLCLECDTLYKGIGCTRKHLSILLVTHVPRRPNPLVLRILVDNTL